VESRRAWGDHAIEQPNLTIYNRHTEACGPPPAGSNESPDVYVGYHENRYGEQWIFGAARGGARPSSRGRSGGGKGGPVSERRRLAAAVALGLALAGCGTTEPTPAPAEFLVDVSGERFVLRLADEETIRLARERLAGRGMRFPLGPLHRGDGGFNTPWSWHLDPGETRMVEAAIEVCDGRPSYVETHLDDYPTYCPWGARVVAER
jgi:hypothetical protein